MQRKRKNRGNWMPVLGHIENVGEDSFHFADQTFFSDPVNVNDALGPTSVGPRPIVPDFTEEQDGADGTNNLHDIVAGNAWSLQRIVGRVHVGIIAPTAGAHEEIWPAIFVSAGFFVARSIDSLQGVADLTTLEAEPQHVDNAMNPWIWRKSWILGNPLSTTSLGNAAWPRTNSFYGSVTDGPVIDSKVKRFISREHRLFFIISARGFNPRFVNEVQGEPADQPGFHGTLDIRVYGSLRKQKNSSAF